MSFVKHLAQLRWHILRSLVVVVVIGLIIFINIQWFFDIIIAGPIRSDFVSYRSLCQVGHSIGLGNSLCLEPVKVEMISNEFGGQFFASFSIAFMGALIIAFPYILWEFWMFIRPALQQKELRSTKFFVFWTSLFFLLGGSFGYFVLGPFTFNFLAGFNISGVSMVKTYPTIKDYIDNLTNIILGCGIAFELPVIFSVLTRLGIVTPTMIRRKRKFAIVILLLAAAIITPSPDWISQAIVFAPLYILFELGILVSARVYAKLPVIA